MSAGEKPVTQGAAVAAAATGGFEKLQKIERYGKYFLVRKIAEGGMAEIFLAKQVGAEGFERNVVIKRMLRYLSEDQSFVSMFLDEAKLAAQLAHQNIVQINELGLAEGCYFIAMEYLGGEDFSGVVRAAGRRREYVPVRIVLKILAEAAQGLHFAHEFTDSSGQHLKIVHRDISPSNIFVTYAGGVKVLDFGIARAESQTTKTTAGVVKGKYMYMSPEQARASASSPVDRRSDVFSLGVSLYETLTNSRPFGRDNDLAVLNAVLHGDFKPPRALRPDLPVELERIVLKAMAHKLDERYESAAAFALDIERYLNANGGAPTGTEIATYLTGLFGEERIKNRSRIESLQDIVKSGRLAPGFSDPDTKTDPTAALATRAGAAPEGATRAVAPPSSVTQVGQPRSKAFYAGVVVALLAAAGAGGYFVSKLAKPGADEVRSPLAVAAPPVQAPPVAVVAMQDAGAVAADTGPGGAVADAVTPDQGTTQVKPAAAKLPAKKRIKLTVAEIQKVVSARRGPIMKCFEQHKEDLQSDSGTVTVQFGIVDSGKVSGATVLGELASTKVGRCLRDRVGRLKFPAHQDKEVKLGLPFAYTVQR